MLIFKGIYSVCPHFVCMKRTSGTRQIPPQVWTNLFESHTHHCTSRVIYYSLIATPPTKHYSVYKTSLNLVVELLDMSSYVLA